MQSQIKTDWAALPCARCARLEGVRMHGERGGAPEGKRNGNYRHGGRTKEIIELWKLIKSLR
jgi:hypothetical protein